jgi:hypothetical protein
MWPLTGPATKTLAGVRARVVPPSGVDSTRNQRATPSRTLRSHPKGSASVRGITLRRGWFTLQAKGYQAQTGTVAGEFSPCLRIDMRTCRGPQ